MALLHALEDYSPRRRFNIVELGASNYLRIDESQVVCPTKIGKDVERFDIRALCGKRAPQVVRSTLQPFARQQLLAQKARSAAGGPVDETGVAPGDVAQGGELQWIARRDHQALAALGEADQLVSPGLQQRLVGALRVAAQPRLLRAVEARQRAAARVQRRDRVHAAAKANVQVQLRLRHREAAQ